MIARTPHSTFHLPKATVERFSRIVPALLDWYTHNQRSFIWRGLRTSPYNILVSEIMLQQTQAQTIEKRLPPFLKQFPTVQKLAKASTSEVLKAWQGLGYNRRALNLHKTAKVLAKLGKGRFPRTLAELRALPGIGLYTASAILVFAFDENIPVVDVNIERVLSRLWKPMKDTSAKLPVVSILQLDAKILPKGKSNEWHQAIMDLGSTICRKRDPRCEKCPLKKDCRSAKYLLQASRAVIKSTPSTEIRYFGQPKRIWRGRILTNVIDNQASSRLKIARALATTSQIPQPEFPAFQLFIYGILRDLTFEGFFAQERSKYSAVH